MGWTVWTGQSNQTSIIHEGRAQAPRALCKCVELWLVTRMFFSLPSPRLGTHSHSVSQPDAVARVAHRAMVTVLQFVWPREGTTSHCDVRMAVIS